MYFMYSYYLYLFFVIIILFQNDYNLCKINFTRNTTSNSRIFRTNFNTSNDLNTILTYFCLFII